MPLPKRLLNLPDILKMSRFWHYWNSIGLSGWQVTALRTGNRKPDKNPYREVGGFSAGGCFTAPYRCVSRVRGNLHARFSGGLGLATTPDYPVS